MSVSQWQNALKDAIRVTQQQENAQTEVIFRPTHVELVLQDAIAWSQEHFGPAQEPTAVKHVLRADRNISVPTDIEPAAAAVHVSSILEEPKVTPLPAAFRFSPSASAGHHYSSPVGPRVRPTRKMSINGAKSRGTSGRGRKSVCTRCHKKKKRCEGGFPCNTCTVQGETCVPRVGKREKNL